MLTRNTAHELHIRTHPSLRIRSYLVKIHVCQGIPCGEGRRIAERKDYLAVKSTVWNHVGQLVFQQEESELKPVFAPRPHEIIFEGQSRILVGVRIARVFGK